MSSMSPQEKQLRRIMRLVDKYGEIRMKMATEVNLPGWNEYKDFIRAEIVADIKELQNNSLGQLLRIDPDMQLGLPEHLG